MKGSCGTRTLFVLIDSGNSHNFINSKIAKHLGCVLEPILDVKVTAINGNMLFYYEMCKQFQWGMQGFQFQEDFLILPLDNFESLVHCLVGRHRNERGFLEE